MQGMIQEQFKQWTEITAQKLIKAWKAILHRVIALHYFLMLAKIINWCLNYIDTLNEWTLLIPRVSEVKFNKDYQFKYLPTSIM